MLHWFTGKSTIGIWPTEFRQYCRFEKLPRLSQEYDNTKFHVVSYCPESPTPLHPHLHPHTAPRQFFKFGNIVEIQVAKFQLPKFCFTVTFTIAVAHSSRLQTKLDVSISFDGLRWLSYRSGNGIYTKKNRTLEEYLHTFLFISSEFNRGFRSFRYISFKAMEDWDHHFQVCEIQIISEQMIINIKRDSY
jgi:hypothetical protein